MHATIFMIIKANIYRHLYVSDILPGIFTDIIYIHGNPVEKYVLSSFYIQENNIQKKLVNGPAGKLRFGALAVFLFESSCF